MGHGLKFDSLVSNCYNFNLVQSLVNRAYEIYSSYRVFSLQLEFLKQYLSCNNFSLTFIESCFRIKLDSIFYPAPTVLTVRKTPLHVKIHFNSYDLIKCIMKQLLSIISEVYSHLQLKLIFSSCYTIASFFLHKSQVPTLLLGNVVYSCRCSQCNATYIGKTSRHLYSRYCEHLGVSPRTFKPVSNPLKSSIRDNSEAENHSIYLSNVKVLHTCKSHI